MCAAKYGMMTADTGFPCSVSVFAQDGTVTVVQSGVDMGQGLYTKVGPLFPDSFKLLLLCDP